MQINSVSRINFGLCKTDAYKEAEDMLVHEATKGSTWNSTLKPQAEKLTDEIESLLPNSTLDYKGNTFTGHLFLYNAPNGKSYDIGVFSPMAGSFVSLEDLLGTLKKFQAGKTRIKGCREIKFVEFTEDDIYHKFML